MVMRNDVDFKRRGPRQGLDLSGPQFMPWMLIFLASGLFVVSFIGWAAGWLAAWISGNNEGPSLGFDVFTSLFGGSLSSLFPGTSSLLILIFAIVIALLIGGAVFAFYRLTRDQFGYQPNGLANLGDLEQFTFKERSGQAVRLRPRTLAGVNPKSLDPTEVGIPLGTWHGEEIYAGFEDVSIAIMAPRSGKTSALGVPQILAAPGPVLVTSNKSDIFTITVEKRQRDHPNGTIWAFDPQGVVQAEPNWFWNPLGHVEDFDTAMELAEMFVGRKGADDQGSGNAEFFQSAGRNYLAYLFLAAAVPTKTSPPATLREVDAWLDTSDPIDAIFRLQAAGELNHAKALKSTVDGPPETVGGIIATARDAAVALKSEKIVRWVTPGDGRVEFSSEHFIDSEDTLYLMSNEKSASAAAPLIAAFASRVFDVGADQASRRYKMRLDPPMVAVLDEAANICKIPGLPAGYSHYGSRGICVTTIFQSSHQPVRVWGQNAWKEMWSAATIKLIGPGIDDPTFAEELSKLVGGTDQETGTYQTSNTGSSYSVSMRQEQILSASDIRIIEKSKMLLLATATKPAMLDQVRYYQGPDANELDADEKRMADLITRKATAAAEQEARERASLFEEADRNAKAAADAKAASSSPDVGSSVESNAVATQAPIQEKKVYPPEHSSLKFSPEDFSDGAETFDDHLFQDFIGEDSTPVEPGPIGDPGRRLPPPPPSGSGDNSNNPHGGGW